MQFTEYTTLEGERWDQIANKAYGDPSKIHVIIQNNFGCPAYAVLPAGIKLQIPILEVVDQETNKDILPPWKRVTTAGELEAKAAVPVFDDIKTPLLGSFDGSFD